MKYLVRAIMLAFIAVSLVSCYDRDILDLKAFNHTLPKVKNLSYTKAVDLVTLKWEIPTDVSADFIRPLEVSIQKVENDIYREVIVVGGEETSHNIVVDPSKTYRFVVKLSGYLTAEAREKGKPERVYSLGEVVNIQ